MRVLIIEPCLSGHHANYLRWIADALNSRGYTVAVATSALEREHPVVAALEAAGVEVRSMVEGMRMRANRLQLVRKQFSDWRAYRRALNDANSEAAIDYVIVPFLDSCIHAIAVLGSPFGDTPWCGIAMRPSFHYEALGIAPGNAGRDAVYRSLFRLLLRRIRCGTIFSIDETLVSYIRNLDGDAPRLRYLPDPIDSSSPRAARVANRANVPENAFVVLVYGAITERKGLDIVLDAVAELQGMRPVHLLVAGKQAPDIAEMMQTRSSAEFLRREGRLHEWNRLLTDVEETLAYSWADASWLGYREHYGMSGVLLLSAFHAVPVVTGPHGLLARLTEAHGLGIVFKSMESSHAAAAIADLQNDERPELRTQRCRSFAERHALSSAINALLSSVPELPKQ